MKNLKMSPGLKSLLRGIIGVLIGVALYLANEPKYAPLAGILPFILRWADPNEKDVGIGKKIAGDFLDKQ